MKGISPLIATVMLIAITLSLVVILATWLASLTKTQTGDLESSSTNLVNCAVANLDLIGIICSNSSHEIQVAISNNGQTDLFDFSLIAVINNTYYQNNTGGPNSTNPLNSGRQTILVYGCDICTTNSKVSMVRVTPGNCSQIYDESNDEINCG